VRRNHPIRLITLLAAAIALGVASVASAASAAPDDWGSTVRLDPRNVSVDGVRTTYAVLGPDSPTPLLLLNGTGSPMSQWDPALLQSLSRDRRVIVYDYPGLGASAPLPGRLTFDTLAAHARGLMTSLGVVRADVLGWSMGGFVAQRLAVRSPGRVRALVLAGTSPGGPTTVLGPDWVQKEDSDSDSTARGYVRANYPTGARQRGWAFVRRVNAAIESGRYPPDHVPAASYDAMVAAEDPWLASGANLRQLRYLTMPVLVMTGADDIVTPPGNARLLASAIPGATLALVPRAGHSFLFQEPRATADRIAGFLGH
jgi:pimeloyl-ACP methyl ester carboxylesterase